MISINHTNRSELKTTTPKDETLFGKLSTLITIGKGTRFLKLLSKAAKEHKQMEQKFASELGRFACGTNARNVNGELNIVKYFEKNFFSILFMSCFIAVNIEKERRLKYGVILHAIRSIVTSTDNILDGEHNGTVFLKADLPSNTLSNVMLALVCQNMVCDTVRAVSTETETAVRIEHALLDSIYSVAKGENRTTSADPTEITPDEIIENVHKKIGGELLRLALIAPILNEKELTDELALVEAGILEIGTALQMLDDLTDFKEDIAAGKSNLLVSTVLHDQLDGVFSYDELVSMAEDGDCYKDAFVESRKLLVNSAVRRALEGFDLLRQAGYPVSAEHARAMLKLMFNLRGLREEWVMTSTCKP